MFVRNSLCVALVASAALAGGCGTGIASTQYNTPERLQRGLVLILPGIEGAGALSSAVRGGIDDAGIRQGLSIYRWGVPISVAGLMWNQMDTARARKVAGEVAEEIASYQDAHPDRPVHLVGHSGGGAVAVFTAEQLPGDHRVDGIVLLSPSLSAGYDLTKALSGSRKGIVHFWSPADVGLLVLGTTLFGNLDGVHGPAAGARGFRQTNGPNELFSRLHQIRWSSAMASSWNLGGHVGTASRAFCRDWAAPWIKATQWPVPDGDEESSAMPEPATQSEPATQPEPATPSVPAAQPKPDAQPEPATPSAPPPSDS